AVPVAQHPVSGQGGDFAGRGDLADGVVVRVRDIHVAGLVRSQARRVPEEGQLRGAVVQGAGGKARFVEYGTHRDAGEHGDLSVPNETNPVVVRIRREDG